MKYFIATIIIKGKKENIGLYAKDKKQATDLVKLKYSGVLLKVTQTTEPLHVQIKRLIQNLITEYKKRNIKQDTLIASIRQLAVLTNAGISIYDSLNEISKSTNEQNLKYIFNKLAEDINSGLSLSNAMENFRYELGNLTLAMIQLGEKTGNLDNALYSLADMLEEIRTNYIKFKKAMAYPRNVMITMAIAFGVLISFVVPNFKNMFEKLNAQLPLPTKILLGLEHIFNSFGIYIIATLFIFFITIKYLINTNKTIRYGWHEILLKTYLIKDIILYSTLNRFTTVFSELLRAGIPISEALDTSIAMIDNLVLKNKLLSVKISVEKGYALSKGLQDTKLFENMIIQMIKAGEDSGTLDSMIKKVADYFKMKFNAIIDGLSGAIEPIILLILACMIVLLALGIFLPMWDMGNAVTEARG